MSEAFKDFLIAAVEQAAQRHHDTATVNAASSIFRYAGKHLDALHRRLKMMNASSRQFAAAEVAWESTADHTWLSEFLDHFALARHQKITHTFLDQFIAEAAKKPKRSP